MTCLSKAPREEAAEKRNSSSRGKCRRRSRRSSSRRRRKGAVILHEANVKIYGPEISVQAGSRMIDGQEAPIPSNLDESSEAVTRLSEHQRPREAQEPPRGHPAVTSVHWALKDKRLVNITAITGLDKQLAEKMLLGNVSGAEQESTAKGQGRAREENRLKSR